MQGDRANTVLIYKQATHFAVVGLVGLYNDTF